VSRLGARWPDLGAFLAVHGVNSGVVPARS
jgi:hypothetical protein